MDLSHDQNLEFAEENDWRIFLDEVIQSSHKHYLWLRSLSYLEFIGYRKMVKSLGYLGVEKGSFHHLHDEIQHSFLLKEVAEKSFVEPEIRELFGHSFIEIAENYFQSLDGAIQNWVKIQLGKDSPYLCYMLTSYLVEKRAMKIYPAYYHRLKETPLKFTLQKIIKDEREHLNYLEEKICQYPELEAIHQSALWDFEEDCFSRFIEQFQNCASQRLH